MARSIESPGVQISEIDLSQGPVVPTGTNVLVAGFAATGPTDEVLQVTSISDFTNIYGQPQTPAERYFYHSVAPLLNTTANVYTYKLPYGANNGTGFGANYGALVYPCSAINIDYTNQPSQYGKFLTTYNAQASGVLYVFGEPTHFELTAQQYDNILQGSGFNWSNTGKSSFSSFSDLGNAGMIVLNKAQTTVNNLFEGYYVGIIDNSNLSPTSNFDDILTVQTVTQSATNTTNYITVPSTRLNFSLSSLSDNQPAGVLNYGQQGNSLSQVLENASTFNIDTVNFDDTLSFGLFKLKQSVFSPDSIKLDYVFSERYIGSLDYWRQLNSQNGGQPVSFFLETREDTSPNVTILVNDFISHKNGSTWLSNAGLPTNKVRMVTSAYSNPSTLLYNLSAQYGIVDSATANTQVTLLSAALGSCYTVLTPVDNLYPTGAYTDTNLKTKDLGSIPLKLDRMFDIAENTEVYNVDVSIDAGMTTIFAVSEYINSTPTLSAAQRYFDDTIFVAAISGLYTTNPDNVTGTAATFAANYATIFNRYSDFAGVRRKDHLFVGDLPRNIFVQGTNFLPLADPNNNFSLNMYSPIRNVLAPFNTSYSTVYANWCKVFDSALGDFCWAPFSGFAAAAMASTDSVYQPWYAPAGFTRGSVRGAADLALKPKQKQRDQLYKVNANPVAFFPNEGFVIYGQKTMLKQPSAFDRINVRRLFLSLEKATAQTVKFFVFEPNTLLTRTRVINTLTPIFDYAKNTEGLYDYLIVCDERNNTPSIIDQNELVVDIYLKPVRTAEFILVNFYATRTSANFNELVG